MKLKIVLMLVAGLMLGACAVQNGKVAWGEAPPYEIQPWSTNR